MLDPVWNLLSESLFLATGLYTKQLSYSDVGRIRDYPANFSLFQTKKRDFTKYNSHPKQQQQQCGVIC